MSPAILVTGASGLIGAATQPTTVRAIASSDIRRLVRISSSPVSMRPGSPSRTARDHLAVEEALCAAGREVIAIRPNVFMRGFVAQHLPAFPAAT
jgi:uncharacterized protein YbjT (DUF2867 family)